MPRYDDTYCNATVGKLIEVANRSWSRDNHRMIVVETNDPFANIIVRRFVNNWQDAEMLIDRQVIVFGPTVAQLPIENQEA